MTTFYDTTYHLDGIEITEGGITLGRDLNKWSISDNNDSLDFSYNNEIQAKILNIKNDVNPNFVGKHLCFITESCDVDTFNGLIVSSSGKFYNLDMTQTPNINGSVPTIKLSKVKNDQTVLGIISGLEKYSRKCSFGIFQTVMDQNDGINRIIVDSLGLGAVWIVDTNGILKNGDYISSSGICGYGAKQDDNIRHNYTVAKITHFCNFKPREMVLKKPVDFTENGPEYSPILNSEGLPITDMEYLIRHVNKNGDIISQKEYNAEINKIIDSIDDISLSFDEKHRIASNFKDRTVFKACLVGCSYCCN
jgi:hypothetical protein